jgi:hypothetical protein
LMSYPLQFLMGKFFSQNLFSHGLLKIPSSNNQIVNTKK